MPSKKQKEQKLKKLEPMAYQIYGIFNFKKKELIFVSLDQSEVEFRFDLENYDDNYDIVSFAVALH